MSTQYPQVTLPNTEVRTLSSSIVAQEYKIFVALPYSYATSDKHYPVLYMTDANGYFGMVTETVRVPPFLRELPEMIIIGIGYPVNHKLKTLALRARDYTPSPVDAYRNKLAEYSEFLPEPIEFKGTGGAGDFLQFIREELMPFVHSTYRTNPEDKVFAGVSLGGLFALYTLFHHPDTFNRYLVGSPSIWWDDKITLAHEAKYAANNSNLSAKVFISVGSHEADGEHPESRDMITDIQRLAKSMQDRDYAGLELATHIFEDETHISTMPATMSRGLRAVFGFNATTFYPTIRGVNHEELFT